MIKTTPLQDRIDPKTGKPKALQHNKNDAENEKRVIQVLWDTQGIKLHPYAIYSPIDYWMEKNNAVIGFAELKTSFKHKNHQFAYLNARKYVNLQMAACGFNCKAYFITQRIDGSIYICDVNNLQGQIKIIDRGLNGKNEREPVKAVPLNSMYKLI
tara:strand:+ start:44 stop:511 length:468 start_codon:yes stop_codon:yes gene_type:complete